MVACKEKEGTCGLAQMHACCSTARIRLLTPVAADTSVQADKGHVTGSECHSLSGHT
jgi:hypothetical protein